MQHAETNRSPRAAAGGNGPAARSPQPAEPAQPAQSRNADIPPGVPADVPAEAPAIEPDPQDKHGWRRRIKSQRAAASDRTRRAEAAAFAAAWRDGVLSGLHRGQTVCAYVPAPGEPGDLALLDAARAAGLRVLVPVTGEPGPLSWAEYTGPQQLRPARYGLHEPVGPALGTRAVEHAAAVLVPALAVDRRGVRLGRGAGYYDRTLPAAPREAALICLVRDDEFVDAFLPEDPHDVRISTVLTPGRGLVAIDNA